MKWLDPMPTNCLACGDRFPVSTVGALPSTAQAMSNLWALRIPQVARVERDDEVVKLRRELYLVLHTTQGLDFVRSPSVGHCFVSERAKH